MSQTTPPTIPSRSPSNAVENSKWAIVSLVCGVFAILGGACVLGGLFGVAGIVAGIAHLRNQSASRGLAKFGLGLSVFGLVLSIGFLVIYFQLGPELPKMMGVRMPVTGEPGVGLAKSNVPWEFEEVWRVPDASMSTLAVGDVTGDGIPELVAPAYENTSNSHEIAVLGHDGKLIKRIASPTFSELIEVGRGPDGPRLFVCGSRDETVYMLDQDGNELWSHKFGSDVNDCRMGDVDGDGFDDVLVGLNGSGGLHLFSCDGKWLWSDMTRGKHWRQAIVEASGDKPAAILSSSVDFKITRYALDGSVQQIIRPQGAFVSDFDVHRSSSDGRLWYITKGGNTQTPTAVVFDESGKIAWETPVGQHSLLGITRNFAYGQLRGGDAGEWLFMLDEHRLAVVTESGTWIATFEVGSRYGYKVTIDDDGEFQLGKSNKPDIYALAVLPVADGPSLLVVHGEGGLRAYRLKRGVANSTAAQG